MAGGAVVKDISTDKKEIVLFFISPHIQGKSYGQRALKMIEDSYPEVKTWRLVTPTQVLRNAVFYINNADTLFSVWMNGTKRKNVGCLYLRKNVEEIKMIKTERLILRPFFENNVEDVRTEFVSRF